MKRILIFSHYHPFNGLTEHILFTLSQLRPYYERVVFVSNSFLSTEQLQSVSKFADKTICRENNGFDFGAWKAAILLEGWDNLESFDSLTLMNDTCFGPLYSMSKVFENMEKPGIDFWGLTSHRRIKRDIINSRKEIPEHIQSYFSVFNRNVIRSTRFKQFWRQLKNYSLLKDVFDNCETRLTKLFERSGFSWSSYINTSKLPCSYPDMATMHADVIVKAGVPFIKIKGFLNCKNPSYLQKLIETSTLYDNRLIMQHFHQTLSPNDLVKVINKSFIVGRETMTTKKTSWSVAIHLHVFYTDILKKILAEIKYVSSDISLYITTDTEEKKKKIQNEVVQGGKEFMKIEVLVVENRGRNIWPWLFLAERLKNYDVVGHFHTKKTNWTDEWFGASWLEETLMILVRSADELLCHFQTENNIGIIIPDIPYGIKMTGGFDGWAGNKKLFIDIWARMNISKIIDVDKLYSPIMPYGNMFWYRPKALQPLFDLNISVDDFPPEPIPIDATLAHTIERLPVYLAWSQGYDFLIACHEETLNTGFDYLERSSRHLKEAVYDTYTWRIGRVITWLPRTIRDILKR